MASRASVSKAEDVEEQSISLLQSDAEAVVRDFSLRLTVLDIIEEGHKAAAMAIFSSVVIGFVLGISLPVDQNIPGNSLRLFLCSLVYSMQAYKHSVLLEGCICSSVQYHWRKAEERSQGIPLFQIDIRCIRLV